MNGTSDCDVQQTLPLEVRHVGLQNKQNVALPLNEHAVCLRTDEPAASEGA